MYCTYCGEELPEQTNFCAICGVSLNGDVVDEVVTQTPKEAKCWSEFANVGFGLGLSGFITSIFPIICIYGLIVGPIALVFSILGLKSSQKRSKVICGIVFSSLAFVIAVAISIIVYVLMYEYFNVF